MAHLTIVRGLPGSGKSTYAQRVHSLHFEADQFFEDSKGNYKYDIKLIGVAHDWCYSNTVKALRYNIDCVVSNTFTKMWELERYLAIPTLLDNVSLSVVEMKTQFENVHGVPEDKLALMASRWEEIPQEWIDDGLQVTRIEKVDRDHLWIFDGVSMHNGEYWYNWYKCDRCGKRDWIASYGTPSQLLNGAPCTED